jgi:ribonuclease HII
MLICGIDEAGRGPVLGNLVMVGTLIEENDLDKLKKLGVKDSKLLTRKKRELLYSKIPNIVEKFKIITVSSRQIDKHLVRSSSNLNILEAKTSARIINSLKPDKVYLDLPDRNAERYVNYIKKSLKFKTEIIAEHKADHKYPIVSAASIIAKVMRDKHIDELKEKYGDFGSGYPSDPKTQEFLKENWNNPQIDFIRKQWASWKNIKKEKEQKKLFQF